MGEKFNDSLHLTLNGIRRNALFASVRYDDIRCAQLKKLPYMVHYHVDNEQAVRCGRVFELQTAVMGIIKSPKKPPDLPSGFF